MKSKVNWQPSASIDALIQRSAIIQNIRAFFFERDFIEIETPLLASYGVTDPYNENFTCDYFGKPYFLQTSPEYHLKRLLCAGAPNLFQLSKAFRYEMTSKHHNPEFTMLEWYRKGFTYKQLIEEVLMLIKGIMPTITLKKYSYQQLFQTYCGFDPFLLTTSELIKYSLSHQLVDRVLDMDKDAWLALIMSHQIEPILSQKNECSVVYDFPASQASLAIIEGPIAKRFEVYLLGVELANGFEELSDPKEQLERFKKDNRQRIDEGLSEKAIDHYFIQALQEGLPACSGVALGIDRLIMAALKVKDIREVMSFNFITA